MFRTRPGTCSVSDGDETWYAYLTHHVGEVYQVLSPSDTEYVRGRVRNVIFIRHVNGFLWSKYAFLMRPRTCLVSDGDETWYASLTHNSGDVYQVSSPSDTEHVRGRVRNVIFIRHVNGFLWSKYVFRMRPHTCSMSDGDET